MTFGAYLTLAKDLAILAALGFILWFVTHAEHNADELKNIKATLGQQQQWQTEQAKASGKANEALQALNTRLDTLDQRGPVIVRVPVPQGGPAPAAASGQAANPAGAGPRSCGDVRSVDIRPVLEGLERKYGTALIECQRVLDSWPK